MSEPVVADARTSAPRRGWSAVALLGLTTFLVVAAEMTPVGLLTPISSELAVSEGTAGLSLAITGLVAAAMAPLTPVLIGRLDRRTAMIALMAVVAFANVLTAIAPTFALMSVARVVLAVGMGGVWALAPSVVPGLVAPAAIGRAMTIVFGGVAVASAVGVPAGAYIGALAGWRAAFWALAVVSLVIALVMPVLLPRLPAQGRQSLRSLTLALGVREVRLGLGFTALVVTAHFTAYTYMRPALEEFAHLEPTVVGTMLLVFGIIGIAGNFVIGPRAARSPRTLGVVLASGLALTFGLSPAVVTTVATAGAFMLAWGFLYGGVSVTTQSGVSSAAPDQRESTSALWAGVFNASIAVGAVAGGRVYDGAGADATMWTAAVLCLAAAAVGLLWRRAAHRGSTAQAPTAQPVAHA